MVNVKSLLNSAPGSEPKVFTYVHVHVNCHQIGRLVDYRQLEVMEY